MPSAVRAQRGFTLIEIIVVLVILGLMLSLIVGHGPLHSQRLDLDATARQITGSLRLARSRAIVQNRTVIWVAGANGFSLDGGPAQRLPADVAVVAAGPIGFAADGSSSGGRIALQGGDRRVAIEVNWLTGRVRLAEIR
jgi:general secretion pathway protein H